MDENCQTDRCRVDQPTRGADHNAAVATMGPSDSLLPSLDPGVTLLDVEGGRGVPVVGSLVIDHLLGVDGRAAWVDANGYAATTSLARLAPSRRLLDRIHVARGFTAYKHYAALCDLPTTDLALVVAPAVDARYRDDDTLGDDSAQTLQTRALATLSAVATRQDCPVLVTRTATDGFTDPVEAAADHRLVCEQTRMGPRFVGDEFETLVYPVGDGAYHQTTFAYWRELLRAGVGQASTEPAAPEPQGATVGAAVTAGGETQYRSPAPLRDAWGGR